MLILPGLCFLLKLLNGTCTTTLHPPARPLAAIHHLRASPLDLCLAAACTVHCLTDENKVLLYGNLEARIFD